MENPRIFHDFYKNANSGIPAQLTYERKEPHKTEGYAFTEILLARSKRRKIIKIIRNTADSGELSKVLSQPLIKGVREIERAYHEEGSCQFSSLQLQKQVVCSSFSLFERESDESVLTKESGEIWGGVQPFKLQY